MSTLKRNLGSLIMSVAELIVGILLLVNPVGFTSGIIIVCGVVLMLWGVISIIRYFRMAPEEGAMRRTLAIGLMQLLGGAFCTFNAHWFIVTFPVLTLAYGVVILVTGLSKVQWTVDMLRMKRRRWYLAAISAVASILCGLVIVANPFATTTVLWMFIGISLMVEAVLDVVSAFFDHDNRPASAEDTAQ